MNENGIKKAKNMTELWKITGKYDHHMANDKNLRKSQYMRLYEQWKLHNFNQIRWNQALLIFAMEINMTCH